MRGRGDRLAASLAERELDLMLVTDLVNVGYLTGFGGTNGACICGPDTRLFLTDFRYTERAAAEVEDWETITVSDDWLAGIAAHLGGRFGFEDDHVAEARIRELGGDPSFPAIVAAGPNGALPHAEPGGRTIGSGELVVFDMGAKLDGYCSDGTRTFAVGEPGERAREVYETVRTAQAAALDAVAAGIGGEELDGVSREVIAAAGHGERFGHGLGHGVGLEVHEAPRVSPRSEDVLAAGEVVTIEPGVYLPGELGVRIEDLVVVTGEGCRNLSGLAKELQLVD